MSHTCLQYKLRFGPKNHVFHVFAGLYFLSLFSEHPVVDTTVTFINHFWCPMGVTIWTIGNGGKYASDGRTIKIFAQNLVDHGSTKIPYFDDFPF